MVSHNLNKLILFILLILFCNGCDEQNQDGCTDAEACNFNADAVNDDGTCIYTDPDFNCDGECLLEIDCLGICGGTAVNDQCGVCNGDSTSCLDCMEVVWGQSEFDECGVCDGENKNMDECGVCFGNGPIITSDWAIQVIGRVRPWGILDWVADEHNIFGVSNITLDGYDEGDLPDPPVFGTNWIRLLFDRSEWDTAFGENFTTDMQSNSFCGPKQWRLVVESNAQGPLELEFIFNNNVALDVFENLVIEVFEEDQSNIISNGTILEYDLEEYSPKEFLIEVEVN